MGDQVHIDGESFHHIVDVCRLHVGAKFEVLVTGKAYFVELKHVHKKEAIAAIIESRAIPQLPDPKIRLCLSLPRFSKADEIIEKCVELGVASVQPFVSDFSFLRKTDRVPPAKIDRWQKIIKSATQQSGRGDLMPVEPIMSLQEVLKDFNRQTNVWGLFPYEGEAQLTVKSALSQMKQDVPSLKGRSLWIFIGSEGGFSHKEVQLFQDVGLEPVTLGDQVLRVETACVTMVSIIKYEFDGFCVIEEEKHGSL